MYAGIMKNNNGTDRESFGMAHVKPEDHYIDYEGGRAVKAHSMWLNKHRNIIKMGLPWYLKPFWSKIRPIVNTTWCEALMVDDNGTL